MPEHEDESSPEEARASVQAKSLRRRTAWHPLAFNLIRTYLPEDFTAEEEFQLSHLPPRIDILLIHRGEGDFDVYGLGAIFERFQHPKRRHAVIEIKSPEDRLEPSDIQLLLGYSSIYMHREGLLDPEEVFIITLSDGISEGWRRHLETYYGGAFREREMGVWEVEGLKRALFCIDVTRASRRKGNHLLRMFSRDFLKKPEIELLGLDSSEKLVIMSLGQRVAQWKGRYEAQFLEGSMTLEDKMEQWAREISESLEHTTWLFDTILDGASPRVRERILASFATAERLKGVPIEERLKGVPAEERLKGVPAEERLKGLSPEEVLEELPLAKILGGLSPEERLKGLSREEKEKLLQYLTKQQEE